MLKQRIKYYISSSHVVTDDPGFKHWFRGSKLVNKNGSPMMVFHGTGRDFKQFAPSQSESGHRTSGIGIWFTDDPSAAHTFAAFARGPDIIRPCYLKLRNPKIYVADGKIDSSGIGRTLMILPGTIRFPLLKTRMVTQPLIHLSVIMRMILWTSRASLNLLRPKDTTG